MADVMNQLSAGTAIIIFLIVVVRRYMNNEKIILNDIVVAVIAGGMLPISCAFAIYPFFPQCLPSIENMSLQITITGLVLIFVYSKTILERMNANSMKSE